MSESSSVISLRRDSSTFVSTVRHISVHLKSYLKLRRYVVKSNDSTWFWRERAFLKRSWLSVKFRHVAVSLERLIVLFDIVQSSSLDREYSFSLNLLLGTFLHAPRFYYHASIWKVHYVRLQTTYVSADCVAGREKTMADALDCKVWIRHCIIRPKHLIALNRSFSCDEAQLWQDKKYIKKYIYNSKFILNFYSYQFKLIFLNTEIDRK